MTDTVRRPLRHSRSLFSTLMIALAIMVPATGQAQYFGQNKVPYDRFHFNVLKTPHWDVHYYKEEEQAARDAARMLERWNTRLSGVMDHTLSKRKPVILYADHPDFQQTNVVSGMIGEGTGGVTESLMDRMTLPMTGYYAETDHVLGHEGVHVFQYDIADKMQKSVYFERMPLWAVEGMAEYLSVGPEDAHTAMWLRDALQRNDLPTIDALTNSGKYFPYRYGEALWAFIGGTWGDEKVVETFKSMLSFGVEQGILRSLGMRADTLSQRWHDAIRKTYAPYLNGRSEPRATGHTLVAGKPGQPDYFVGPAISPDGKTVAYFYSGFRGVELRLADAATGESRGTVAAPGLSTRFDALSFLYSAGSWSPDGKKLAFVSYADGDNEIEVVNVEQRKLAQKIKPEGIGAISTVAWSPDGTRLAFSGMTGGVSDLYLYDFASHMTRRLTNDLNADLQPAWSPDGQSIAFITDRDGPQPEGTEAGADFHKLTHAPLRLAVIDANTGRLRVLPAIAAAKHVSPQFTADGKSILFVSDRGGFSDIYRLEIESGALFQVTKAATGVSGISEFSPALSVSIETGAVAFSVFEEGGMMIATLTPDELSGERLPAPNGIPATAAILPGGGVGSGHTVSSYVTDYSDGLPPETDIEPRSYRPNLRLAYIGPPSLAVSSGGPLGTTVQGGASAYFTDLLGNHFLGVAATASGTVRDIGGQVIYINSERRITWGLTAERTPYVYGYGTATQTGLEYVISHVSVTGGSVLTQYARNPTQRFELSLGHQYYSYFNEARNIDGSQGTPLESPTPLSLSHASLAWVGDDAVNGYTSPIAGTRFRFEATPTLGTLNFQNYLADFREYIWMRPFTLAFRGIHIGRYGRDAESDRIGSIFVGDPSLIRGYGFDTFVPAECTPSTGGSLGNSSCAQFDRLLGSKVAVANLEFRIPLFGARGLGLINTMVFPPIEITPFLDAGVAWTSTSAPVWDLSRTSTERTPVVSGGVAGRMNVFGFAVIEVFYARPFQRMQRGGVWGFSLMPGW